MVYLLLLDIKARACARFEPAIKESMEDIHARAALSLLKPENTFMDI
jgi:hypothetical protein